MSDKSGVDELNVDFENFSLPKERSEELRSSVQRVKDSGMVDTVFTLVQELGVEEVSSGDNQMASLIKAKNPKVFRLIADENSETPEAFEVFLYEQEMRVSRAGRPVLEVSFLPKDKDFILFYIEESFLTGWDAFKEVISASLVEAGKIKNDRQKHFKKFKKEVPRYENPSEESPEESFET